MKEENNNIYTKYLTNRAGKKVKIEFEFVGTQTAEEWLDNESQKIIKDSNTFEDIA